MTWDCTATPARTRRSPTERRWSSTAGEVFASAVLAAIEEFGALDRNMLLPTIMRGRSNAARPPSFEVDLLCHHLCPAGFVRCVGAVVGVEPRETESPRMRNVRPRRRRCVLETPQVEGPTDRGLPVRPDAAELAVAPFDVERCDGCPGMVTHEHASGAAGEQRLNARAQVVVGKESAEAARSVGEDAEVAVEQVGDLRVRTVVHGPP